MKIAIPYEDGQIFQHFGHTARFKLYDVQDGKIVAAQVLDTNGSGHGALAGLLQALNVDALICGGIGGGARMALDAAGIRLYGGVQGSADEAARALAEGRLTFDPDAHCDHHDHGEGIPAANMPAAGIPAANTEPRQKRKEFPREILPLFGSAQKPQSLTRPVVKGGRSAIL